MAPGCETEKDEEGDGLLKTKGREILSEDFSILFHQISDQASLNLFRFKRKDLNRCVSAVVWPEGKEVTTQNMIYVIPLLFMCSLLCWVSNGMK